MLEVIKHNYFSNNCMEPYEFFEHEEKTIITCPVCNNKMEYWCSVDINDETHKVTKRWVDSERQKAYPENKNIRPSTPPITYPYCKSTDCKKISGLSKVGSVALWGIFALGKTTKQWHCNNCKSDF